MIPREEREQLELLLVGPHGVRAAETRGRSVKSAPVFSAM